MWFPIRSKREGSRVRDDAVRWGLVDGELDQLIMLRETQLRALWLRRRSVRRLAHHLDRVAAARDHHERWLQSDRPLAADDGIDAGRPGAFLRAVLQPARLARLAYHTGRHRRLTFLLQRASGAHAEQERRLRAELDAGRELIRYWFEVGRHVAKRNGTMSQTIVLDA